MNTFKIKSNRITLSKSDIFTGKIHQKFKPILGYSSRTYSTSNSAGPNKPALTWSEWAAPYFTADYYYLGYGVAAAAAITTAYVSYCYIIPTASAYLYNNSTVANGKSSDTNVSNASLDTVPRADYEVLAKKLNQIIAQAVPRADYDTLGGKIKKLRAILENLKQGTIDKKEYNALANKLSQTEAQLKEKTEIIQKFIGILKTPEGGTPPLAHHENTKAELIINSCNKVAKLYSQTPIPSVEIQHINNTINEQLKSMGKIFVYDETLEDAIVMACSYALSTGALDMDPDTLNGIIKTVFQIVARRYNDSKSTYIDDVK